MIANGKSGLKDSAYRLDQFTPKQIEKLEAAISMKDSGKKAAPYVSCIVRGKPIRLTPEEAVRQLFLLVLLDEMGYPVSRMELDYEVTFGREKKR
ncbi:MAG: type I restriction enzyme HsdR N-terminal domain-containing protein, partial [Burkholderiales bacterium]